MDDAQPTTVLVVDDDPGIRGLLTEVLPRHGCVVWTVPDGDAAVRAYRQSRAGIGVVLLDVGMPVLDGPQTFHALRAVDPRVRVVFMARDPVPYTESDLALLGAAVVWKPFTCLFTLAAVLRRVAGPRTTAYPLVPVNTAPDVSSRTRIVAPLSSLQQLSNHVPTARPQPAQPGRAPQTASAPG